MAVKIVQKEIKFYSELVNGSNFDLNQSLSTPTLADSVTGRCKSVATVEVTIGMNISNFQILYADTGVAGPTNPNYKIVKDDATFLSEGFTLGSEIALTFDTATVGEAIRTVYLIVDSLTDTELYVTYNGVAPFDDVVNIDLATLYARVNSPANPEAVDIRSYSNPGYIAIEPSFTGLSHSYNLIENSAGNVSLVSNLTNTTNVIKVKGIPTTANATVQTGVSTSKNKAAVMGDVTVELLDKVYNNNALLQLKFGNRYEITNEFVIPYFYDGEEDNIEDTTTPPDLYNGTSSPKYIYETTWYTDINDPNTGSTVKYSASIGASGYLDEAFNGDENPYTVNDLAYFDVTEGVATDRLNIGKTTRVNFNVSNIDSDFTEDQLAVAVHGAIVPSSEYSSSTDIFDDVWTFETLRADAEDIPLSGTLINDYKITWIDSSNISIQLDVTFTTAQNSRLEEDQFYLLAVQLSKNDESIVLNSHKVHLKVDYNQYGKNNDIEGLYGVSRFEQIPHPNTLESNTESTIGYTNGQYNIEEGGLSLIEFWLDNSKGAELSEMDFQIGVYNTSNQEIDVLRNTSIDVSDSILSNGSWQIRLSETVGFPLKEGDQFNFKTIVTGDLVGSKQFYTLLVGYKIPWQEWLKFSEAPTELFDPTKQNDGLNNNSSNYSTDSDYQIRLFLEAIVLQDGIPTTYKTGSENINVYDYNEDDSIGNDSYTCEVATFNNNDVAIEGNIIEEGYTQVKAVFTPKVTPVFTEPVDMTEVSTAWGRIAHGELWTNVGVPSFARQPNWVNGQADDNDFFGSASGTAQKNDVGLYTSTPSQILANENNDAYYGCISIDKFSFYSINGKIFSDSADNDALGFVLAFDVDENGIESTLSLLATTGGALLGLNPSFDVNDPTSGLVNSFLTIGSPTPSANLALVYNYGKRDCTVLDTFLTGSPSDLSWNSGLVGDLEFTVNRSSDDFEVIIDWTIDGIQYVNTFNYNLMVGNLLTEKFHGAKSVGFAFFSQDQGGFKDVELSKPSADFWSNIKIESENSSSDNGLFELSNDIEGDKNNLLKQLDPSLPIVSSFGWDNTSFVNQVLVNTNRIKSGENYKLSAEIGSTNLGVLDLLTCFAWVDSADRSKLYVKFNTNINLATVTTTGLTILSGGITITSYVIGESVEGFLVFTLSGNILAETENSFVYSGTNTIKSEDNSLSLGTNSITIYDI